MVIAIVQREIGIVSVMGDLKNAKYEKFCQLYSTNGNNGTEAYLGSFKTKNKSTARAEAPKIIAKPSVRARLDELAKETEKAELITREGLIDEMNNLKSLAIADNQLGVAKGILEMQGKMIAAFTEKVEQKNSGSFNVVFNEDEMDIE